MTHIVDTSVWIAIFKDKSGLAATVLETTIGVGKCLIVPPIKLELLQGCRGETEWRDLSKRVAALDELRFESTVWERAARIYFELRQSGQTLRSVVDCLIAQLALDHQVILLHNDRDFEKIATIRPLQNVRLELTKAPP